MKLNNEPRFQVPSWAKLATLRQATDEKNPALNKVTKKKLVFLNSRQNPLKT